MKILMLYQNDSWVRVFPDLFKQDGYSVVVTGIPAEALRIVEASDEPYIIFTDSLKVNPTAVETLRRLRANPALSKHVRVIGFDIDGVEQMELDIGAIDVFVPMSDRGKLLWKTLDALTDELSER